MNDVIGGPSSGFWESRRSIRRRRSSVLPQKITQTQRTHRQSQRRTEAVEVGDGLGVELIEDFRRGRLVDAAPP